METTLLRSPPNYFLSTIQPENHINHQLPIFCHFPTVVLELVTLLLWVYNLRAFWSCWSQKNLNNPIDIWYYRCSPPSPLELSTKFRRRSLHFTGWIANQGYQWKIYHKFSIYHFHYFKLSKVALKMQLEPFQANFAKFCWQLYHHPPVLRVPNI